MNWSAPITNGTWSVACYISAKRESGGATLYVSIAIAAGWYDFPQYKLDVIVLAGNTASIVSVGTPSEEPAGEPDIAAPTGDAGAAPSTAAAPGTGLFSGTGSVRAQAGAMARVVGDAYPITLGLGFSAGIVLIEFYQNWSNTAGSQWFKAEDFFPAFRYSAELTIPIVSIGRLSAGFQYVFVPVGDLTLEHDGGSDYYIAYYEPNLGGLVLRIGLVAEL